MTVRPRLCLNMIVKNEEAILERCLRSHIGVIDCFVIHDTGSTDSTVGVIERFSAETGIPGIVSHGIFEDFSQARNEALDAARSSDLEFDYLLLADADMELQITSDSWRDEIAGDAQQVIQSHISGTLDYPNTRILRRDHPARYVGLTHEYLDTATTISIVTGIRYIDHASGSNRTEKYERDIRLLKRAVAADPNDSRSWFYLGNSYLEIGRFEEALVAFERRLSFDYFPDERFVTAMRIGRCLDALGRPDAAFQRMLAAFDSHPVRAESLHWCAQRAQTNGLHRVAHMLASTAKTIAKPEAALFVDATVYDWRLDDIIAVSLYWMGDYEGSIALCESILPIAPAEHHPRIIANIEVSRAMIAARP